MDNKENVTVKEKPKFDLSRSIFEWVELVAISITVVMVILNCFARYSPVNGASMNETLQHEDVLILSDLFYTPKNGDIVVFESQQTGYDEPYVKRVIATEGQVVDYDPITNKVTVDGVEPEWEQYATYKNQQRTAYYAEISYPYTVPKGHIFVMGDNRWNSRDSRDIGPVDVRTVLGRVVFRLFPNTGIVD
ncbi:MAG: signal peptidase I [Clostridia bacterium]|nr:signal peptidase I [Clostridia bacterium]